MRRSAPFRSIANRSLLAGLLFALLSPMAFAQKLELLPAVPPPPPEMAPFDAALEPQITIRKRESDTVEEYRVDGRLYMIKVTPSHGVPYYLIDDTGSGNLVRREAHDTGIRPPMWTVKEF